MVLASGLVAGAAGAQPVSSGVTVTVFAAGSLRGPITQAAQAFADDLCSGAGQQALRRAGFMAP